MMSIFGKIMFILKITMLLLLAIDCDLSIFVAISVRVGTPYLT